MRPGESSQRFFPWAVAECCVTALARKCDVSHDFALGVAAHLWPLVANFPLRELLYGVLLTGATVPG